MVSSHKARQIRRAENIQPKNVSIIVEGITKVIPWKEYQAMEEYFPPPEKEEVIESGT